MKKLQAFCTICGSSFDDNFASKTIACPDCSSGLRTMELASGLLGAPGCGYHVFLRRFARDPAFSKLRLVDMTSDPIIERELRHLPNYHQIVIGTTAPRAHWRVRVNTAVSRRPPFQDGSIDVLLVRDMLRVVPDLGVFVRECFRLLASGGSLVLQDNYRWPFPDKTTALIAASTDAGTADPAHAEDNSQITPAPEIGASLIGELNNTGFISYFERPMMSSDPFYRGGFVVGIKS